MITIGKAHASSISSIATAKTLIEFSSFSWSDLNEASYLEKPFLASTAAGNFDFNLLYRQHHDP